MYQIFNFNSKNPILINKSVVRFYKRNEKLQKEIKLGEKKTNLFLLYESCAIKYLLKILNAIIGD